jgi:hypothetical protein
MRKLGPSGRAAAILVAAGAIAFAISTAAASSATTRGSVPDAAQFPFAALSFTGGVSTSNPAKPSTFSLSFTTAFTLASNSPGIVNKSTGTLDNVTIEEHVSYPVPGGKLVGPVQLPFKSEKLMLVVAIKGSCFVPGPAGGFVFQGSTRCATSTLTLGSKTYKVSALLKSITGSFTPDPTGAPKWTSSLQATFSNPGYTFPVATLGSGGLTTLLIGPNGAGVPTKSVSFTGAKG